MIGTRQDDLIVSTAWTTTHLVDQWRTRVAGMGYRTMTAEAPDDAGRHSRISS
ncbi:MAG: hypothetical protein ACOCXA_01275 [Planctomycetota bacterium]